MSCTPFEASSFQPITSLENIEPSLLSAGLLLSNISQCQIYSNENQCLGYCDTTDCYEPCMSPINEPLNCSFLLLIVNLYSYIQKQLNCSLSTAKASSTNFTIVNQNIILTINNPDGNISNTTIGINQSENIKVTMINIQESQVQQDISSLITTCIQQVIEYANTNPTVFNDTTSQTLLEQFGMSTNSLSTISSTALSFVLNTMIQGSDIIITLNNVQYNKATIQLTQSSVIELLSQNIAIASINKIINIIIPNMDTLTPTSSINKKKKYYLWIIVIVGIIVILILLITLIIYTIKKTM
jgi:hypothetical protein